MADQPEGRRKTSPWVIGCLAGCGLAVLVVGGLFGAGAWYVHSLTSRFDQSVEAGRELEARFGEPSRYTPPADGAIPADRLEAFLAVRADLQPQRARVRTVIAALPISAEAREALEKKHGLERITSALGIGRGALDLAPALGEFFAARSRVLLERGMGMGEYEYLYLIAYGAWLKVEPGEPTQGAAVNPFGSIRGTPGTRLHEHMIAILKNQARSIAPGAGKGLGSALAAEIERLEEDPGRFPWQDGLPEVTAASLEPFRERIIAAWEPLTHGLELATSRKSGRFSYRAD